MNFALSLHKGESWSVYHLPTCPLSWPGGAQGPRSSQWCRVIRAISGLSQDGVRDVPLLFKEPLGTDGACAAGSGIRGVVPAPVISWSPKKIVLSGGFAAVAFIPPHPQLPGHTWEQIILCPAGCLPTAFAPEDTLILSETPALGIAGPGLSGAGNLWLCDKYNLNSSNNTERLHWRKTQSVHFAGLGLSACPVS